MIRHLDFFQVPHYSTDMGVSLNRLLLFVGLAANVAFDYLPTIPFANILWSVPVEEQFYLFWLYVAQLKRKLLWIMILLLSGYLVYSNLLRGAWIVNLNYWSSVPLLFHDHWRHSGLPAVSPKSGDPVAVSSIGTGSLTSPLCVYGNRLD